MRLVALLLRRTYGTVRADTLDACDDRIAAIADSAPCRGVKP